MEVIAFDIYSFEFFVGHLDSTFIFGCVQCRVDLQSLGRFCARDQFYNQVMADQRTAPPILCHMTKQAMFDLVPLAGARRKVADVQDQTRRVGQFLQRDFPETATA